MHVPLNRWVLPVNKIATSILCAPLIGIWYKANLCHNPSCIYCLHWHFQSNICLGNVSSQYARPVSSTAVVQIIPNILVCDMFVHCLQCRPCMFTCCTCLVCSGPAGWTSTRAASRGGCCVPTQSVMHFPVYPAWNLHYPVSHRNPPYLINTTSFQVPRVSTPYTYNITSS